MSLSDFRVKGDNKKMLENIILDYCNKYNGMSHHEIMESFKVFKAAYTPRGGLIFSEQEIKDVFNQLAWSGQLKVRKQ